MNSRFKPAVAPKEVYPSRERIILIGFMGAGKSVVGKLSADLLEYDFCDSDAMIEAQAGRSISEIFSTDGEAAFRRLEHRALTDAVLNKGIVIATGGGSPLDPKNASLLRNAGILIHLAAQPHTIASRLDDPSSRPLLAFCADPAERIASLMRDRRRAYADIADITIDTDDLRPEEIARQVALAVDSVKARRRETPVQSLKVRTSSHAYSLWSGSGLIRSGAGHIISREIGKASACLVTHPHLARLYGEPLARDLALNGIPTTITAIPPGESHKNLNTVRRLYSRFVEAGLDRDGLVVAVGGGVIGDIAGFAAASYLRGIRCVQVPTTLLAQVDSSVGGKTGVDLPEGKNLVGAFHQPIVVILDPEALATLPNREIRSGLAEVIKYGIITDDAFFYQTRDELKEILTRNSKAISKAILRSCEIKAAVVGEDEKEHGRRAILNFGHTVGHAIETATQYKRFRHGEAISIGMVSACLIGEELGITPCSVTQEVTECLERCGLPIHFPEQIHLDAVHAAMLQDKKTRSGKLRFVIAEKIGAVRIVEDVSPNLVDRAIARQKPAGR